VGLACPRIDKTAAHRHVAVRAGSPGERPAAADRYDDAEEHDLAIWFS
jgi:hypothetical protein